MVIESYVGEPGSCVGHGSSGSVTWGYAGPLNAMIILLVAMVTVLPETCGDFQLLIKMGPRYL